jgi:hypothetical protein
MRHWKALPSSALAGGSQELPTSSGTTFLLAGDDLFFDDNHLAASGVDLSRIRETGDYVPARGVLRDIDTSMPLSSESSPRKPCHGSPAPYLSEGVRSTRTRGTHQSIPCSVGVFTTATITPTFRTSWLTAGPRRHDGSLQTGITAEGLFGDASGPQLNLKAGDQR